MTTQPAVSVRVRIDHPTHGIVYTDVSLHGFASFADVLDGLFSACDLPLTEASWFITTPLGQHLPSEQPIGSLPIEDGDLITIGVAPPVPAPILKDAAQALSDLPATFTLAGLPAAAVLAGGSGMLGMAWRWRESLSPGVSGTAVALMALVLGAALRSRYEDVPQEFLRSSSGAAVIVGAAAAGGAAWWQAHQAPVSQAGMQLTGLAVAALYVLAYVTVARPPAGWVAAVVTVLSSAALWAGLGHSLNGAVSGAACAIAWVSLVQAIAPRLAMQVAGLKVPPLPTRGDPLPAHTEFDPGADRKAKVAHELLLGMCVAQSAVTVAGMAVVAQSPRPAALVLAVAILIASAVHAVRLRSAVAAWSQWLIACGACVACAWAAPGGAWAMAWAIGALFILALSAATPLFSQALASFQPTTVRAIERVELLAVVAIIPSALTVAGVFGAIRSLG